MSKSCSKCHYGDSCPGSRICSYYDSIEENEEDAYADADNDMDEFIKDWFLYMRDVFNEYIS